MIKTYKNQIFQNLSNHPSGVNNFLIKDYDEKLSVTYIPFGGFHYTFEQSKTSFDNFKSQGSVYKPNFPIELRMIGTWYLFKDIFSDFIDWQNTHLNRFIENESQLDLWDDHLKMINAETNDDYNFNNFEMFSQFEKRNIIMSLNEVRVVITKKFTNGSNDIDVVNNRINYLIDALDRLNKIDWKGIFINTIIAITIALSLDAEKGRELYNLFLQFFQSLPRLGN